MEQQKPAEPGLAIGGTESLDERYEQLVAVAQRLAAGASPDTSQPDRVTVSHEALETLRAVLANF